MRLLTSGLKGLSPQDALRKLRLYTAEGKLYLEKVLKQAQANATENFKLDSDGLVIKSILVNEGMKLKRVDKSHGARFDRGIIKKRYSNLTVILKEKSDVNKKLVAEIKPSKDVKQPEALKKESPPSPRLRRINGAKN